MVEKNKILVLTSGPVTKLEGFDGVDKASFSDINFTSGDRDLYIGERRLDEYEAIYFRLVGKSLELASLVAEYAKQKGIKIIDRIYTNSQVFPITMSKAMEMKALADSGVSIPRTLFGKLDSITKKAKESFGFPFVLKSTSGKKGREVYSPQNEEELMGLLEKLMVEEKSGKNFFAQEFVNCVKRTRVMIVGEVVIGGIYQLTKWRRRVDGYTVPEEEIKIGREEVSEEVKALSLSAVKAVGIDIAGVDILEDVKSKKQFVIEVNAAPAWKLINKYCELSVENEIIKFIQEKI